jgi:hypothetical protein
MRYRERTGKLMRCRGWANSRFAFIGMVFPGGEGRLRCPHPRPFSRGEKGGREVKEPSSTRVKLEFDVQERDRFERLLAYV